MSRWQMARPVGFFTGIILGGTLAAVTMVLPFVVAAIVSCCVLLFILASDADSSNKESLFVQGLCGSSPAESEMGSAAQPQAATPVTSPAATGLTRVLRSWDFISIAVCQLCLGIFSGGHQTLMAVVLKTVYLMPSTDVALAMAFVPATIFVAIFVLFKPLKELCGVQALSSGAMYATAATNLLLVFLYDSHVVVYLVLTCLQWIAFCMSVPTLSTLAAEAAKELGENVDGSVQGVSQGAQNLGSAIGPMLFVYLFLDVGQWVPFLLVVCLQVMGGTVMLASTIRKRRQAVKSQGINEGVACAQDGGAAEESVSV